jgi:hypothetical protein
MLERLGQLCTRAGVLTKCRALSVRADRSRSVRQSHAVTLSVVASAQSVVTIPPESRREVGSRVADKAAGSADCSIRDTPGPVHDRSALAQKSSAHLRAAPLMHWIDTNQRQIPVRSLRMILRHLGDNCRGALEPRRLYGALGNFAKGFLIWFNSRGQPERYAVELARILDPSL